MALVSRFAGEQPLRQIEAAAPAPYPLAGDVYPLAGDVAIDDAPHQVRDLGAELRFLHGRVEQQIHLRGLSQCRPLRSANLRKPR